MIIVKSILVTILSKNCSFWDTNKVKKAKVNCLSNIVVSKDLLVCFKAWDGILPSIVVLHGMVYVLGEFADIMPEYSSNFTLQM